MKHWVIKLFVLLIFVFIPSFLACKLRKKALVTSFDSYYMSHILWVVFVTLKLSYRLRNAEQFELKQAFLLLSGKGILFVPMDNVKSEMFLPEFVQNILHFRLWWVQFSKTPCTRNMIRFKMSPLTDWYFSRIGFIHFRLPRSKWKPTIFQKWQISVI